MIAQLLYLVFIVLVEFRIYKEYAARKVPIHSFLLWALFWLLSAILVFTPRATDTLARLIGLQTQKGIDLIIDGAIIAIFYSIWKIMARLERIEKNITTLTRERAYEHKETRNHSSHLQ